MRYIEIKLDSTPIQMEPVTIRQYNNLVDTVVVKLKSDMDGLVVEDYNVFIQTDLIRRDKIPLTPCRSSVDIVVEEGYLGYTWPIDSAVTRYKGVLQFEVQLEHKTDVAIPIWQSEVCKLITVAPNICDNTSLGDDGPAILQEVYQQLQTLDDQVDQAAASATNAAESKRLAGISAAETVEAASLLLSGYVTDAQTAKTGAETAQGLAEEAQGAAEAAQGKAETASDTAEREADRSEREADDALDAKDAAETAQGKAEDALAELVTSVVNSLTDGGVDVPLSAEMGKELDGKITNLATNAATATDGQILASNGDGTSEFITQNSDLIETVAGLTTIQTEFYNKPKTDKKIVFVGDSTTEIAPEMYTRLSELVKTNGIIEGATIVNRGCNGNTLNNFINNIAANGNTINTVIADQADLYVLCYGINDIRLGLTTKAQVLADLKTAVDALLADTSGYILLRTPNIFLTRKFSSFVDDVANSQKYMDYLWEIYESFRGYSNRLDVIDIQSAIFGRTAVYQHQYMKDTLHPNDMGYRIVGEYIAEHISHITRKDYYGLPISGIGVIKSYTASTVELAIDNKLDLDVGDYILVGNIKLNIAKRPYLQSRSYNSSSCCNTYIIEHDGLDFSKYGVCRLVKGVSAAEAIEDWKEVTLTRSGSTAVQVEIVVDLNGYDGLVNIGFETEYFKPNTSYIDNIQGFFYFNDDSAYGTVIGGVNTSSELTIIYTGENNKYGAVINFDKSTYRYLHMIISLTSADILTSVVRFRKAYVVVNEVNIISLVDNEFRGRLATASSITTVKDENNIYATTDYVDESVSNTVTTNTRYSSEFLCDAAVPNWFAVGVQSGTLGSAAGTNKHPGVNKYTSHASNANSGYAYRFSNVSLMLAGGEKTTIIFKTATALDGVLRRIGFHGSVDASPPVDGVYVKQEIDGGDSKCYLMGNVASNSVIASTATKYELTADTWYRIAIEINATGTIATYTLYADDSATVLWTDVLEANGSTVILPTVAGRFVGHADVCTLLAPSAATIIGYIDYMDVILPNARRIL